MRNADGLSLPPPDIAVTGHFYWEAGSPETSLMTRLKILIQGFIAKSIILPNPSYACSMKNFRKMQIEKSGDQKSSSKLIPIIYQASPIERDDIIQFASWTQEGVPGFHCIDLITWRKRNDTCQTGKSLLGQAPPTAPVDN